MSAILLAISGWEPEAWLERFRALAHGRAVRLAPDFGDSAAIAYACVWKQPAGLLAKLPKLKAIFSLGAGVDHLLADPSLPDVPIARIVDADLTSRMTGHVALHALLHQRRMKLYEAQQRERVWRDLGEAPAEEVRVGVLGMGALGAAAAEALRRLGFRVSGFSRSPKAIAGIESFAGDAAMNAFLGRTDILVCLFHPMMPHLAEECWAALGHQTLVSAEAWPQVEPALLVENTITLPVQINGKKRADVTVARDAGKDDIETAVLALDAVKRALDGKRPKKVIVVPQRIVNVVA